MMLINLYLHFRIHKFIISMILNEFKWLKIIKLDLFSSYCSLNNCLMDRNDSYYILSIGLR